MRANRKTVVLQGPVAFRMQRLAAADGAAGLRGVGLDLHPPAAAAAALAAGEVAGEEGEVHPQSGGQSGEQRGEPRTVALTAGRELKPAHGGEDISGDRIPTL